VPHPVFTLEWWRLFNFSFEYLDIKPTIDVLSHYATLCLAAGDSKSSGRMLQNGLKFPRWDGRGLMDKMLAYEWFCSDKETCWSLK
jgi:hypothetical protein